MEKDIPEMQDLQQKIDLLLSNQERFQKEIEAMKVQINHLKARNPEPLSERKPAEKVAEKTFQPQKPILETSPQFGTRTYENRVTPKETLPIKKNKELEKFIGENLVNKIGILLLIIGVAIGVKYAIDHEWITPLMRIILGYLVGAVLVFFAARLKEKYLKFSAVLYSGALAIFYFITYAAHAFYGIYPSIVSILMMIAITVFTVALAIYFDRQVIAHIGLVGAYIIPYVLKEPFADTALFFTYISIVNIGILLISLKKKWKYLFWFSFVATWTILLSWVSSDSYNNQTSVCITFISIWFLTFYLVLLSYKIRFKEELSIPDIVLHVLNSAVLFGVGYLALKSDDSVTGAGIFTLLIAVVHAGAGYFIYKSNLNNKTLFNLTAASGILFLTIAFGILFENRITTVLWGIEALILFWSSRKFKLQIFEYLSYPVIFITFIGVIRSWLSNSYDFSASQFDVLIIPFLNKGFLTSVFVMASFGLIYFFSKKTENVTENTTLIYNLPMSLFNYFMPALFIAVIFFGFFAEFSLAGINAYLKSACTLNSDGVYIKEHLVMNRDILRFKNLWLINYSLFFLTLLSFINFKYIKTKTLNLNLFLLSLLLIFIFFTVGLSYMSGLRDSYLHSESMNYSVSTFHILIRYICYGFFALLFYSVFRFVISDVLDHTLRRMFEIILCISIFIVLSFELIYLLDLSGVKKLYGYGLSILWGVLSMATVIYGIWKNKKYLRITGIVLFGITLYKLFFHDLEKLETIAKTIVFLIVGVLLLIVSFLYNKYTKTIFGEDKNQE